MTTFQPFDLERVLSKYEKAVEYNLSESGVHPMTVRELVDDPAVIEELLSTELGYAQANGVIELRERIAALYPGATPDNVLVTVGWPRHAAEDALRRSLEEGIVAERRPDRYGAV